MRKWVYSLLALAVVPAAVWAAQTGFFAYPFTGRWQPAHDPLLIEDNGFQDIQNMRRQGNRIRGVLGHTRINTNLPSATYKYPKNAFHFKKDLPAESHVFVQLENVGASASYLYENETAIPSAGDFNASSFHTDASGAGLGRFSYGPQGTLIYTNGAEALIWPGDEGPITKFVTSTADVTGNTVTNPKDYSEAVLNTLTDSDQLALVGGGIDSYAKLVLHADGADAGTTFTDSSATGHTVTANGNAQIDTDRAVFGVSSGLFDGAGDYLSVPDHADWNFGTSEICLEARVNFDSPSVLHTIFYQADGAGDYDHVWLYYDGIRGKVYFEVVHTNGTVVLQEEAAWSPSAATWYKFALIRGWGGSANGWAIVVNGTAIHTFTSSITLPNLAGTFRIGGGASWSTMDYSGQDHPVLFYSNAAVTADGIAFDGTDDYVSMPDSPDWDIVADNTSTTTVELWVDHADHAGNEIYLYQYQSAGNQMYLMHAHGAGLRFVVDSGSSTVIDTGSGGEITDTDPHHVVLYIYGTGTTKKIAIYNDGTQVAYTEDNSNVNLSGALIFGGGGASFFQGNLGEIRIYNGNPFGCDPDAGLTDTISVPSGAHDADANTALLIHGDVSDFDGHIDEVRVSNGAARFTANYTLPSKAYSTSAPYALVGSWWALSGVKCYIENANYASTTVEVDEWNGNAWTALTVTDGTSGFTTTGEITWGSTVTSSEKRYIEGLSLYWYKLYLPAGEASLSTVRVIAPMQTVTNVWDGSVREIAACKKYNGTTYVSYTDEVQDDTTAFVAELDSLANTHYLLLGFTEPQQGFEISIPSTKGNGDANTLTVAYWDGEAWQTAVAMSDGTLQGSASLSKSGVVSFTPPASGVEFPRAIADEVPLYYYKLSWSGTLDAETEIYHVTGIANPDEIHGHAFAVMFQNRAFLFDQVSGYRNRARYSVYNAPIFNGEDSGELYFGNEEKVNAAAKLYNVYRESGFEQLIVTKESETWRLYGDGPENWQSSQLSGNIGCIAPLSMKVCETTAVAENVARHVVLWVAGHGVVQCDGATIDTVSNDIENYFDPSDSDYITPAQWATAIGEYDPNLVAYKLIVPAVGLELEYSLKHREWTKLYRANGSGANPLTAIWQVRDTSGKTYLYGMTDEGYIYRTEYGNTWNGTGIAQYIWTKDFMLSQELPYFRQTTIDGVQVSLVKKTTTGQDISFAHYADRVLTVDGTDSQAVPDAIDMDNGPFIYQDVNLGPANVHSLKLSCTTTAVAGMELTGLGFTFVERERID